MRPTSSTWTPGRTTGGRTALEILELGRPRAACAGMRRERWCRKHCGHPMRRSWHRHQDRWQRAVSASACLNGELVGAGGLVERVGLLACQASRHEPAERVAHSDPPHPAGGLAQRCKAETASAAGSQHRGRRALLGQGRAELVCSNACCREQGSPAPSEEATHSLEQRLASG